MSHAGFYSPVYYVKRHYHNYERNKIITTVNGERFAGLNFRGFQEHRESFPVNIYKLRIMALFKCCKRKAPRKFFREKLH